MIDYDPHTWRTMIFSVRGSMLPAITWRVALAMVFATLITLVHFFVMPMSFPEAATAHGLIGPALGLLLVFRTNASYDRWWEGRKLWGTIMNVSRNLARAVSIHFADDPVRRTQLLKLLAAWPVTAMHELRSTQVSPTLFEPEEAARLEGVLHLPTAVAARLTAILNDARKEGRFGEVIFTALDADCHTLVDAIGACERIHKTPLPFAYVVHLRRALILFCGTLPFALLGRFGVWACVITFIVSYVMFGIEEIGVEIEDPFEGDDNDLPLKRICSSIQKNVLAFLPQQVTP